MLTADVLLALAITWGAGPFCGAGPSLTVLALPSPGQHPAAMTHHERAVRHRAGLHALHQGRERFAAGGREVEEVRDPGVDLFLGNVSPVAAVPVAEVDLAQAFQHVM